MEKRRTSAAPLFIAIAVLVLPLLYVGSYVALVTPRARFESTIAQPGMRTVRLTHYRIGRGRVDWFFWPLEQIDRSVRPGAWGKSPAGGVWQVPL